MEAGFQSYGGYAAEMPMDGMDGNMMYDDYPGSMPYPEPL